MGLCEFIGLYEFVGGCVSLWVRMSLCEFLGLFEFVGFMNLCEWVCISL